LIIEIISIGETEESLTQIKTRQKDIASILRLSTSTVSEHIKNLRSKGILDNTKLKVNSIFHQKKQELKNRYYANPTLYPNNYTVVLIDLYLLLRDEYYNTTGEAFTFEMYSFLYSIYLFTKSAKNMGWIKNASALARELNINRLTATKYIHTFCHLNYICQVGNKYLLEKLFREQFDSRLHKRNIMLRM
jgi:predicted transcriptional regulator